MKRSRRRERMLVSDDHVEALAGFEAVREQMDELVRMSLGASFVCDASPERPGVRLT